MRRGANPNLSICERESIGPCLDVPYHMLRFSWSELYFGEQATA